MVSLDMKGSVVEEKRDAIAQGVARRLPIGDFVWQSSWSVGAQADTMCKEKPRRDAIGVWGGCAEGLPHALDQVALGIDLGAELSEKLSTLRFTLCQRLFREWDVRQIEIVDGGR